VTRNHKHYAFISEISLIDPLTLKMMPPRK